MVYDLLYVVCIIGIVSIPMIWLLWKSQVETCRYALFDVRDKLVYFVASGILQKDGEIFRFYYPNVNRVLHFTEAVQLEELIRVLKGGEITPEEFAQYSAKIESVGREVKQAPEEIKEAIGNYYTAFRDIIFINSNFFAAIYLFLLHRGQIIERFRQIGIVRHEPEEADAIRRIETECRDVGLVTCD
ncbi:MAG: hypothetical protein ACE5JZ_04485 [Kiloniellales bacterium]